MKSGQVFLGVLVGVAAGALLGIVFAPEKGSRTRKNMINKGENYIDDLKGKFDDFLGSMNEKFENTWHEAEGMVSKEKAHVDHMKKEVKNSVV